MAVRIRLKRMGAKKKPFYRIVVADSRSPRDGRFIEEIGTYDPMKDPSEIIVDAEKAAKWIFNGAQPTESVKTLFKRAGVITDVKKEAEKEDIMPKKVFKVKEEPMAEEAPEKEAPKDTYSDDVLNETDSDDDK